jgi:hypothetical protein
MWRSKSFAVLVLTTLTVSLIHAASIDAGDGIPEAGKCSRSSINHKNILHLNAILTLM